MSDAATIAELKAEVERLRNAVSARDAKITCVTTELENVKAELRAVLAKVYGPRTEKLDSKQLQLFVAEIERVRRECEDDTSEPLPSARGKAAKRTPRRKPLPEHLERRQVVHDVPEDERACPCCVSVRPIARG